MKTVDAKSDLEIEVIHEDILRGKAGSHDECTYAQTLMRCLNTTKAYVGKTSAKVLVDDHMVRYIVPRAMRDQQLINDVAGASKVTPGKYLLKAPSPSKRLGQTQGSKKKSNKKNSLAPKRAQPVVIEGFRGRIPV